MWSLVAQQPGSTALTPVVSPAIAISLIIAAILVGYGCYRLSRVEMFARFRPYLLLGVVGFWGFAAVEAVFVAARALTPSWFILGLFLLALLAVTNYQWMRNVMAGLALAFEDRLHVGDSIDVAEYRGTIRAFGLRSVVLRGRDGRHHEIPNARLVDESVSKLGHAGDAACDVTVTIPEGVRPERARMIGRRSAVASPLASPHRAPEAYVEAGDAGSEAATLRVRGYVFDAAHQERYESDLTSRLLEQFGEKGA